MDSLLLSTCLPYSSFLKWRDPKFLLIGSGEAVKKNTVHETCIDADGWFCAGVCRISGVYFNTNINGVHSFDLTQIAGMNIPIEVQKLFFPFAFIGFGIFTAYFHFIHGCPMVTHRHRQQLHVSCWHIHEIGRLWMFKSCHLFNA
jgi:NADH:ubiquinone oxidoreductase subunit 4 (chain M)